MTTYPDSCSPRTLTMILSAEAIIRRILAEIYFARPPRETGVSQLCTGRWQEGETTARRVVPLGFSPHLVRSNRSPARGKMGARDSKGDSGIGLFPSASFEPKCHDTWRSPL